MGLISIIESVYLEKLRKLNTVSQEFDYAHHPNQIFLTAFSSGFVAMPVMRPRKMRAAFFLHTEDGSI
jgi:hypothetical protein